MPTSPVAVPLGIRAGVVMEFDDPRGLGVVVTNGGEQYRFHCANIADGSRQIDVGAAVTWKVVPGRLGQWEAADLQPVAGAGVE
jgi:CspA family cold shock protein